MARTEIKAGTTIDINFTLPQAAALYDKFFVYIYTAKQNIVKFAYPDTVGYGEMTVDDATCTIKVLSSQSAKFNGALYYEIKLFDDATQATEAVGVGAVDTGIDIVNNYIKSEQ